MSNFLLINNSILGFYEHIEAKDDRFQLIIGDKTTGLVFSWPVMPTLTEFKYRLLETAFDDIESVTIKLNLDG